MNEGQLSEEVISGVKPPEGATEIPNGINMPVGQQAEVKEEKILGKFTNQEDLVKAYQELESKLGSQVEDTPEETTDTTTDEETTFDISKYASEYTENGELSESSYKELAKEGYQKDIVDAYVQGQAALGKQWIADVKAMVGSEEQYTELIQWASQGGVDPEFIAQYDEAVGSMDSNKARMAVEALKSLYKNSDVEPKLLDGNASGKGQGDIYESWQQLTTDLNSDLYHKDPAERERVQKKLSRSKL